MYSEHDLGQIFKSVWGYNAPPLLFGLQNTVEAALFPASKANSEFGFGVPVPRREISILGPKFYAKNANGNEVFMPTWLIAPGMTPYLLQNTVMSLTNKKTIIETPMVNRRGSVKEEISIEDWEINIKGIIVSEDFDYPDYQVQQLLQYYNMGIAIEIENARTALALNVDNVFVDAGSIAAKNAIEKVVIKSLTLPELKGMKNLQAFEMNLVSDNDFDLIIG